MDKMLMVVELFIKSKQPIECREVAEELKTLFPRNLVVLAIARGRNNGSIKKDANNKLYL